MGGRRPPIIHHDCVGIGQDAVPPTCGEEENIPGLEDDACPRRGGGLLGADVPKRGALRRAIQELRREDPELLAPAQDEHQAVEVVTVHVAGLRRGWVDEDWPCYLRRRGVQRRSDFDDLLVDRAQSGDVPARRGGKPCKDEVAGKAAPCSLVEAERQEPSLLRPRPECRPCDRVGSAVPRRQEPLGTRGDVRLPVLDDGATGDERASELERAGGL